MRSTINERKGLHVKGKAYSLSMASTFVASYPPSSRVNLYAQELNNSAASCIEIGLYDRAIISLKRALILYKRQQNTKCVSACSTYQYTLDGCIVSTEKVIRSSTEKDHTNSEGFISKHPIKVPARGHTMGPALIIIISYNLGLAYHLIAIGCDDRSGPKEAIRCSMASYNLAFETQTNLFRHQNVLSAETAAASIRSIRFNMMVINNMSQLHKLNSNEIKHDRCLQLLLPIIMLVVDQQVRTPNTPGKNIPLLRIELDGFLQNTGSLILRPKYTADAA